MAKCEICNKSVSFGIKVSHSHRRSNKMWKPNVRRVRAVVTGEHKRIYVCTRCLRSGLVERGHGSGLAKASEIEMEIPEVNTFEAEDAAETQSE